MSVKVICICIFICAVVIAGVLTALYRNKKREETVDFAKLLEKQTVVSTLDVSVISSLCKNFKEKYSGEKCVAAVMTLKHWTAAGIKLPDNIELNNYVVLTVTDNDKKEVKEIQLINFNIMSEDMKELMAQNNDVVIIEI